MARRDNQGIQIAMIVFILTTLLFMVTTYFGYSSSTALKGQVAQLEGDLQNANSSLSSAVAFATNLKTLVGLDGAMEGLGCSGRDRAGRAKNVWSRPPRGESELHRHFGTLREAVTRCQWASYRRCHRTTLICSSSWPPR